MVPFDETERGAFVDDKDLNFASKNDIDKLDIREMQAIELQVGHQVRLV